MFQAHNHYWNSRSEKWYENHPEFIKQKKKITQTTSQEIPIKPIRAHFSVSFMRMNAQQEYIFNYTFI